MSSEHKAMANKPNQAQTSITDPNAAVTDSNAAIATSQAVTPSVKLDDRSLSEMSKFPTDIQAAIRTSMQKYVALIGDSKKAGIEIGFAIQAIANAKDDKLLKCSPQSLISAILQIARTGLTLNPVFRMAYLIPRGDKACLEPSYIGLMAILKSSGAVRYIESYIVYEDEDFTFDSGMVRHRVNVSAMTQAEQDARTIVGAYSRAILPHGESVFLYMPFWELEKIKNNSKAYNSEYSPYKTWKEEMYKKSPIKRHFKYLTTGDTENDMIAAINEIIANDNLESNDLTGSNGGGSRMKIHRLNAGNK